MSEKVIKRGFKLASYVKMINNYWIIYKNECSLALEVYTMTFVFGRKDIKDALTIFNRRNKLNVKLLS